MKKGQSPHENVRILPPKMWFLSSLPPRAAALYLPSTAHKRTADLLKSRLQQSRRWTAATLSTDEIVAMCDELIAAHEAAGVPVF